MHKDGQIVLHVPSSDPQIKLDVEGSSPKITLAMGDVQIEIVKDTLTLTVGDATIKALSSGGRIDVEVGDASAVLKKNGDITLKGKNITLKGSGNVEIAASAKLKLSGAQVEVN
jgi:type VI secretion system secreted protein VgrG